MSNIRLNEKELPAIKNWQVGKKYKISVEVEMKGLEKRPDYDKEFINTKRKLPEIMQASFDIKSVSFGKDVSKMTSKEFSKYDSDVRSGRA